MEITKDKLHLLTGIIALAFGIYCLIIGIVAITFGLAGMNGILLIISFISAIIYIIYGISIIFIRKNHVNSLIGIGFIAIFWLPPDLEWFIWPMIIMPYLILALFLAIIFKNFHINNINR